MNREGVEVRRSLAVFAERPTPVADAETRALRRQRASSVVLRILQEPKPPRSWSMTRRIGQAVAALSVAAAGALALGRGMTDEPQPSAAVERLRSVDVEGSVFCRRGGETNPWVACGNTPLGADGEIRTLDRANVELVTHADIHLDLSPESRLAWSDGDPPGHLNRVELTEGRLSVRVPRLPSGTEFSVVTPTATVIVHGTAFVVEVEPGKGEAARTCVRVTEGIVSVRHAGGEDRVAAPASWGCEPVPAARVASVAPPEPVPNARPQRPIQVPGTPREADPSTLAVETRLLQLALAAERRGDLVSAEETLRSLLGVYPRSVVAPEARAVLSRVLRASSE